MKSGIYLLRYSRKTVKLGRSKNIEKRLESYRGYHKTGKRFRELLIIKTKNHKRLEKDLHKLLEQKYERISKFEIFYCRDQKKLVEEITDFLKTQNVDIADVKIEEGSTCTY